MVNLSFGDRRFMAIEAVILDKDGTLAAVEPYLHKLALARAQQISSVEPGVAWGDLLAAWGIRSAQGQPTALAPAGLMAVGSRYENQVAAAAYVAATGRSWAESMAIAQTAFDAAAAGLGDKPPQTPPLAGVTAALTQLHQRGLKLGILSSDTTANIDDFLIYYGLTGMIQAIAGADQTPAKPDPAAYQALCRRLGVDPQKSLMVGDSRLDLTMAQAAGAAGTVAIWGGWSGDPEIVQRSLQLDTASIRIQSWAELKL